MKLNFKESLQRANTKSKIIFWDIDGTLAPYRFNGHVADPDGTENGMSYSEINDGLFLKRKPSKFMQHVVETSGAKQNIIIGHARCEKEIVDKNAWLDKYYPEITERLLIYEEVTKYEKILSYCKEHKIDLKNVIFVDDVLSILRESERHGILSYHISSFLDWDYED